MNRFPEHHIVPAINVISGGRLVEHRPIVEDRSDTTMPKLIEALGGADAFESLPVLDLNNCTAGGGGTGYTLGKVAMTIDGFPQEEGQTVLAAIADLVSGKTATCGGENKWANTVHLRLA